MPRETPRSLREEVARLTALLSAERRDRKAQECHSGVQSRIRWRGICYGCHWIGDWFDDSRDAEKDTAAHWEAHHGVLVLTSRLPKRRGRAK
jgi:hypothetical protein